MTLNNGRKMTAGSVDLTNLDQRRGNRSSLRTHGIRSLVLVMFYLALSTLLLEAQPRKIILDTDMLTDPEDVNALWLLNTLADRGEAEILACVVNGHEANRASGAAVDVVNTWFGRPHLPIGSFKGGYPVKTSTFTPLLREGYPHLVPDDDALPDAVDIYRSALAKQPDHSVVIASIGFLVNLRELLKSKPDSHSPMDGLDLIRAKVKELVVMGGKYPQGLEYNFSYGGVKESAADVIENWPHQVPVVFIGYELGFNVQAGKNYRETLSSGPLRLVLRGANVLADGRATWDELTVLYAVRGLSYGGVKYFDEHSTGYNLIDRSDGSNRWVESPDTNQAYLSSGIPTSELAHVVEELILTAPKNAIHFPAGLAPTATETRPRN